jgi:hypothetical protein
MAADFVKHLHLEDGANVLQDACILLQGKGATWLRCTSLLEVSADFAVLEGWLVRPNDEGPYPDKNTLEYGLE